jgi:hypothetical protein
MTTAAAAPAATIRFGRDHKGSLGWRGGESRMRDAVALDREVNWVRGIRRD